MAESTGDAITVTSAARLLGLRPKTVYRLIEDGHLGSVQSHGLRENGRPQTRRTFHLTRQDVDDFLERARVKPGDLSDLYPPLRGGKYR